MIAKCKKCGGNPEVSRNVLKHECWPEYRAFMMSISRWNEINAPDPEEEQTKCAAELAEPTIVRCKICGKWPDPVQVGSRRLPTQWTCACHGIQSFSGAHWNMVNWPEADHIVDANEKVPFVEPWYQVTSELGDRVQSANEKHGPFADYDDMRNKLFEEIVEFEIACKQGNDEQIDAEAEDICTVVLRWLIQRRSTCT